MPPHAPPTSSRIDTIFAGARDQGRRLLMPFVCAGHPGPDSLPGLLKKLESSGAAIAEVGIPFSDPIADGPVIAEAMHRALEGGITPGSIFDQIKSVRDSLDMGLVAMVSASVVFRAGGPEGFAKNAADAGFDGVIYPDVSLEEAETFFAPARDHGLSTTMLISPNSTPERRAVPESPGSGVWEPGRYTATRREHHRTRAYTDAATSRAMSLRICLPGKSIALQAA